MIVVAGFAFVILTVPLLDGRLSRLGIVRFDKAWLVALAMAIQVPITTFATTWIPDWTNRGLHLFTYALALAFVWYNKRHVGMAILVTGALCNLLAIASNGGVMPASEGALVSAGIPLEVIQFENSGFIENPNFGFLGDIFSIPAGWPLANVFSIGDILLVIGGGWMLHWVGLSRAFPNRRRKIMVEEFLARVEAEENRFEEAQLMQEILHEPLPGEIPLATAGAQAEQSG